ncbi:tyrosine-type recombinase/integrase [Pedococcus sp. P5_B7]
MRHYFASLLISAGLDVKVVQARLQHASPMTTLNTYGHAWPNADESARAAGDGSAGGLGGRSLVPRSDVAVPSVRYLARSSLRYRSTSRTRAGAGGSGSGRPRSCASTRSRSR